MKKSILCIVVLLGLALLMGSQKPTCCSMTPEQITAIEKAVLGTHDKIIAAAEKLDAETMFSYILDNDKGTIIQGGQLMTYQETLDQVKTAFNGMTFLKYDFRQRNINVLSPTIALMISSGTTTSTMSSQTFTSEFANTSVFVLKDGTWKIIHGHHSIPNPQ